ncbi:MAG: MBL fold metallo-hydrolase [Pirellula sp.]|jgi:phosphoribosyl 1,2-cyclic phosphate phosphodiesterase
MILLGTGTSVGVPVIGCGCPVCRSPDPRNNRTRCSVAVGLPGGNLLIDTPPDLRNQLLREHIGVIHSVLFTHEHADHLHGMDDLRLFPFILGGAVPVHATLKVQQRIKRVFDYAFEDREPTHAGAAPKFDLRTIDDSPFETLGVTITPIPMSHGPYCDVLGFRIGNVAYCTDTNNIPDTSLDLLRDLDCLVLDALRFTPHPTHFNVDQAVEVIRELKPRRAYLTHLSHDLDYAEVNATLPDNIELGYDGLRIPLS